MVLFVYDNCLILIKNWKKIKTGISYANQKRIPSSGARWQSPYVGR